MTGAALAFADRKAARLLHGWASVAHAGFVVWLGPWWPVCSGLA